MAHTSNKALYKTIFAPRIIALSSGSIFRIRDILPNPPALVGKMVYNDREILRIVQIPDTNSDCNVWMKL